MSSSIQVRDGRPQDAETLVSFNRALALETEHRVLNVDEVTPGVAAVFQRPELAFYLVAEISGHIAGALMVTSEWSDWRNGLFWWIQSVYVSPEYRKRGVYRALYAALRQRVKKHPEVCGFRLYVERGNAPAMAVYQRLGMSDTGYTVYEMPISEGR